MNENNYSTVWWITTIVVALLGLFGILFKAYYVNDIEEKKHNYQVKCKDFVSYNKEYCKKYSEGIRLDMELNSKAIGILAAASEARLEDRSELVAEINELIKNNPEVNWKPLNEKAMELGYGGVIAFE